MVYFLHYYEHTVLYLSLYVLFLQLRDAVKALPKWFHASFLLNRAAILSSSESPIVIPVKSGAIPAEAIP